MLLKQRSYSYASVSFQPLPLMLSAYDSSAAECRVILRYMLHDKYRSDHHYHVSNEHCFQVSILTLNRRVLEKQSSGVQRYLTCLMNKDRGLHTGVNYNVNLRIRSLAYSAFNSALIYYIRSMNVR